MDPAFAISPAKLLQLIQQHPAPPIPAPPVQVEVFTEYQQRRLYEDAWRVTFESIG